MSRSGIGHLRTVEYGTTIENGFVVRKFSGLFLADDFSEVTPLGKVP